MVCPTIFSPFEVSIDNNYHHLLWSKVEFLGIGELCPCFVIRIADLRLKGVKKIKLTMFSLWDKRVLDEGTFLRTESITRQGILSFAPKILVPF